MNPLFMKKRINFFHGPCQRTWNIPVRYEKISQYIESVAEDHIFPWNAVAPAWIYFLRHWVTELASYFSFIINRMKNEQTPHSGSYRHNIDLPPPGNDDASLRCRLQVHRVGVAAVWGLAKATFCALCNDFSFPLDFLEFTYRGYW